jgi:hypothetical protein
MSQNAAKIILPLVLLATIAVAIFGAVVMGEPGHMAMGCLGLVPGVNCSILGPIEHFEAHLNTFKNISTAVVGASSLFSIIFLLLLAGLFLNVKQKENDSGGERILRYYENFISPHRIQFMHWLALREKRDPSFAYAMNV